MTHMQVHIASDYFVMGELHCCYSIYPYKIAAPVIMPEYIDMSKGALFLLMSSTSVKGTL